MRWIFIYGLFFVLLAAVGCKNDSADAHTFEPGKRMPVRSFFRQLAKQMAEYGRVDGKYTGFAAVQSEQYARYHLLSQYAYDEELVELTNDTSAAVRVYAFQALVKRNYSAIFSIYKKHLADTTLVISVSGCVGGNQQVNDLMKSSLTNATVWMD